MCRASRKPSNNIGLWLASVVARPAKRHQIFQSIRLGNGPRDDVVNIQFTAFSGQIRLSLPACFAGVFVSRPCKLGLGHPVSAALVVPRRPAFPLRASGAALSANARGYIAGMSAEPARFAIETLKRCPAMCAVLSDRLYPAPSGLVVTRHVAEPARVGVIGKSLKGLAATLTGFECARLRLGRLTLPGAIRPAPVAREHRSAFFACLFHRRTIAKICRNIKYFDIACRRVDEASRQPDLLIPQPKPQPVQEGFDL